MSDNQDHSDQVKLLLQIYIYISNLVLIFNTFFETLVNAKCEGHNFGHSYIAPTIAAHTKLIIYTCNCIEKDIFRFLFQIIYWYICGLFI